jgi:hypothetical protein
MRLADRIAQCRAPFIVQSEKGGSPIHLNNAAAFAKDIGSCATRYVLSDELTRLCAALAYSKGASTLPCADLLHVPAERVWVEWTEAPWLNELARYGFKSPIDPNCSGRRGAFVQSNPQGRRGLLRTFWADRESESRVFSSSMEAYFDFDVQQGNEPEALDRQQRPSISVSDDASPSDILRRCFRFRFERSWQDYYESARLTSLQAAALSRHALGTIAIDIPVLLAFFLLLVTRPSLPRRPLMLERLNTARARSGKVALLEQIEVFAPLTLRECKSECSVGSAPSRRPRRLHHVRGHLVRRGSKLFWRVPHLRGSSRVGSIRARTVTWFFEPSIFSSRINDNPRASAPHAS